VKLRPQAAGRPSSGKKSAVTAPDTIRSAVRPCESHVAATVGGDARQRLALGFDFNERGAAISVLALPDWSMRQLHQLAGFGIGQRLEQDGIDHAEDGVLAPMPSASVSTATAVKPGS
jgi:hypothetical protein